MQWRDGVRPNPTVVKGSSRLGCLVNRAASSWGFVLLFSAAKEVAVSDAVVNVLACADEDVVWLVLIAISAACTALHGEQVTDESFAMVGRREGRKGKRRFSPACWGWVFV